MWFKYTSMMPDDQTQLTRKLYRLNLKSSKYTSKGLNSSDVCVYIERLSIIHGQNLDS